MTNSNFSVLLDDTIGRIRKLLTRKTGEYCRGDDRLSNFKRAAEMAHKSPVASLQGMVLKHFVSLFDMLDDYEKGAMHPLVLWDEKVLDIINYMILLRALLLELQGSDKPQVLDALASAGGNGNATPMYQTVTDFEKTGF